MSEKFCRKETINILKSHRTIMARNKAASGLTDLFIGLVLILASGVLQQTKDQLLLSTWHVIFKNVLFPSKIYLASITIENKKRR